MIPPDVSRRGAFGAAVLGIASTGFTAKGQANTGAPDAAPHSFSAVNVFDNLTSAQRRAVKSGVPVPLLVEAIEEIANAVGQAGGALFLPAGLYDFRRQFNLHPLCWLVGEGAPWPQATYNPGRARASGVVIFKNHNDPATILVTGGSAYALSGGIEGISISGDATNTAHNRGNGLVIDKIGSYSIKRFRAFSVPGDALVLGKAADDATGQVHLDEIYINNPAGICIVNRSRWLKASKVECDGGMISYAARDGAQADLTQFHFEGARRMAVRLAGANTSARFRGGFIMMSHAEALKMVEVGDERGNTDITFDGVQMVGRQTLEAGIEVMRSAWRTAIINCEIIDCSIGVRDHARGTRVFSKFLECGLNIEARGDESDFSGSRFMGTRGPWAIDHREGSRGLWTGMHTDKPFKASASGLDGNFGSTIVKDNQGYRSFRRGKTSQIVSGTPIDHGLAAAPHWIDARTPSGYPAPTIEWRTNAQSIIPVWKGGGSFELLWQAALYCDAP